jgi:hypothetical protein
MRALPVPTLERWLSRGGFHAGPGISVEDWLWQRFAAAGTERAIAPVTWALDAGDPEGRWWMRADPVHFIVGRTGLRLAPLDTLRLDAAEASALADAIRRHFDEPRFELFTPSLQRWYLGADSPFDLATTSPASAVGDDVDRQLPRGPGRREWLRFMNEVQMLWFEHPVNLAREQRGEPVASSLWLHGAGRMPAPGSPPYTRTAGGDSLLAALSALAGRPWCALDQDAGHWLESAADGRWLLQIDTLAACAQAGDAFGWRDALVALDREWFTPLDRALRTGRLDGITLTCPSSDRLRTTQVAASDRFRFWRPVRALATHA